MEAQALKPATLSLQQRLAIRLYTAEAARKFARILGF